jgi:FAD:protein FMN transferase
MPCAKRMVAALVCICVSAACTGQSSTKQTLVYKKKYVMGTVFEIAAYDSSSTHASEAIERAFQQIARIDDLLSNYKPESALSHLNRSAHFHSEKVPPDLYGVIDEAVRFSRLSQGKFDISVAPLVDLWKSALSGEATPSAEQQQKVRQCVGYEKIELNPPDRIAFRSSCLRLDLGAIGKGYALDKAGEMLRSAGIRNALINAGGSTMLALGSPPGQTAWLVHLRDPSHKIDPEVMLKDQSISTSEQSALSFLGIDSPGHIVDPETGRPVRTEFAVSVVAKTGTLSDALSTTLLLLGPAQGKTVASRMADVSAIWISPKAQMETVTNGPQIVFGKPL